MLQTDNRRELINGKLKSYIEEIDVDYIFGAPYQLQSQGETEALN